MQRSQFRARDGAASDGRQIRLPHALEIHKAGRHLYPRDGTRRILRGAAQFLMMVHPLRRRIAAEPLRQAPFPSIVARHVIFK